ncbi:hypothetical protein A5707_18965 [Mycobacterium kyorinense]|uniref:CD225/dispanin family protein n=1 Tax=Mycobacterium kyorinense TaxID=487514 RepID=A0A1A2ZDL7_9MYCO|nr:CD225/dispanin family protein [Mycobacterium kyorinense]OBI47557.1 hypothetical protein A5707_18965 [Mycobacterium kyorinense]
MTEQPPGPPGNYPPPPPGGYPPPPPPGSGGYPPQGPPGYSSQPDTYLVWAILSTVLCCLPLGIVSIVKSSQVSGLWAQGRYAEAHQASQDAKKWAIWSAVAGVIVIIIALAFNVVSFSAGTS